MIRMTLAGALLALGLALADGVQAQTVPAAQAHLDQMDARRAVPLLPHMANHQKENMRGYLMAVQTIVAALATDDFAAIQKAAATFGYSEEQRQMCENMGAAAPGFAHQAIAFHKSVDLIEDAARDHDKPKVVQTLGETLAHCTACHATWKQQVVDEQGWMKLTRTPAQPMMPMHGGEHDHAH